ncbi:uncharacterized protein CC84DRAFT_1166791 [Paraphaeosphaeria sporulosa]|uniref:Uncharacterized protein n=1 Tax=Paraphaeosphaeria sporulosa TaxID=1460663 RepID=A0A177C837_9PLEO|nr:uncharacterized protein CC84DRAFT_1166791 [Paraphaeosphaeria sporulosa]OAG03019.1 hypothetical protein CC84DRAFT_1166791 [Paraphaeosphaeria sporulosa]
MRWVLAGPERAVAVAVGFSAALVGSAQSQTRRHCDAAAGRFFHAAGQQLPKQNNAASRIIPNTLPFFTLPPVSSKQFLQSPQN